MKPGVNEILIFRGARDGLREDDAERRFFVDKYIYMYIICP
jgi:hypothetical protein